jgi:aspartyl-tRNA(Asn)/glutamyl-tRNA(Gln) amidotransferase subunit A
MATVLDQPLSEIGRRLEEGALSATDLVAEAQSRHDPSLNAYKAWTPEFALRQAQAADSARKAGARLGPLQGIPVSVKDIYGVEGLPIFVGSPRELPESWRREGPIIRALRGQLAVVMGKSHTVEFAFGGLGTNKHWGAPKNPWDRKTHRAPGGSSSGAGVSLGEGTALLALGTDTGGSVRIPASVTGNVGLKTTKGRWSTDGIVPLSTTFDTAGLLTRSVEDMVYAFEALDGTPVPRGTTAGELRLAVGEDFFWAEASAGVAERAREAIALLADNGGRTLPLAIPGCAEVYQLYQSGGIVAPELYRFLSVELPEWIATLDPRVGGRMASAKEMPAWVYLQRKMQYDALGRRAATLFEQVDAVLMPTVPITPPPVAEVEDEARYRQTNMLALRNTCVVNFLGLCAITVPVGLDAAGMPVGLQIVGAPNHEPRLLAIAALAEKLLVSKGLWRGLGGGDRAGAAPGRLAGPRQDPPRP